MPEMYSPAPPPPPRGLAALCEHFHSDQSACLNTLTSGNTPYAVGAICALIPLATMLLVGLAINEHAVLSLYGLGRFSKRKSPLCVSSLGVATSWVAGVAAVTSLSAMFCLPASTPAWSWHVLIALAFTSITLATARFCGVAGAPKTVMAVHFCLALVGVKFFSYVRAGAVNGTGVGM